jgi:holo-[acyl-carrier protein] synthase
MTLGIGIDAVPLEKCSDWLQNRHQLKRIFSEQEIAYCFKQSHLTLQRIAVRFAVREAFFKALSTAQIPCTVPFLTVCKLIEIQHSATGVPILYVDWKRITSNTQMSLNAVCSLTHIPTIAIACVVITTATL